MSRWSTATCQPALDRLLISLCATWARSTRYSLEIDKACSSVSINRMRPSGKVFGALSGIDCSFCAQTKLSDLTAGQLASRKSFKGDHSTLALPRLRATCVVHMQGERMATLGAVRTACAASPISASFAGVMKAHGSPFKRSSSQLIQCKS